MSSDIIGPPNLETVILDYLRPLLGVPCSTNVPNPRPSGPFLVLNASPSAGLVGRVLFRGLVTLEAWASTRPAAWDLARKANAYLASSTLVEKPDDVGGPGWLPDPVSGSPRYVSTAATLSRGVSL